MIARRGFTGVDKFRPALGDGGIVFRMHRRQRAGALQVAHRLQYLVIAEFVLVGQIELKAADAAIHHHRDLVENAVVNVLDNAVKTVVDNGFIGGVAAIDLELVAQVAADGPEAHMINNGGGTAAGRGPGAGKEIIAAAGETHINIEMRMNVDAAGHHVAALGVNHFAGLFCLNRTGKALDEAIFNEQVLL